MITIEEKKLLEDHKREKNWKRWGPYLSERQWATVREDYSKDGKSWEYFPHDQARSRAYRWGEDGLLGITDRECRLCFALALWNGKDPILKERLYGLSEPEGNHGEDVKECYYYLDSSPTHSYMKALYKYPQEPFPYHHLLEENQRRGLKYPEYEITDTGIFDTNDYYDVFIEYAKNSPDDLLIRVEIVNRGHQASTLHFLPTLWFRNTWSWRSPSEACSIKPQLQLKHRGTVEATHITLGNFLFSFETESDTPIPLFTENNTNLQRLFGVPNASSFVKDSFHDFVISGKKGAINTENLGTKCSPYYLLQFGPRETKIIRMRLYSEREIPSEIFGDSFQSVVNARKKETDEFYQEKISPHLTLEEKKVSRQAYAGLLWTKQFFYYVVKEWLDGDPGEPPPPIERKSGRNADWVHLYARDVISMPDKWEYPWFAAWDLSFHMIPFAKIDPNFAKQQMILFLREWYMHPNGQQPAYEYGFSDVNPPVHAWACWRIYKITGKRGERDEAFLESVFQKLLINFTWWVNRKDAEGKNLFSGGFLGMDNIGVFNRSKELPHGAILDQADGTGWMAFYCLTMLSMALELATVNPVYEDMASKFFEHFIRIADSINQLGGTGLWDEGDGFYYDQLRTGNRRVFLKTRSLVGLLPLIAVEIFSIEKVHQLPGFAKRLHWFLEHRKDLENTISYCDFCTYQGNRLLALLSKEKLQRILKYLLDENEFLSPYGIRSLSKYHEQHPFHFKLDGQAFDINYVPGVGESYFFGGNSNWRGPIWFPINFLIIESLERYYHFYGDSFLVECPTGSGKQCTLKEAANEISRRLSHLFLPDSRGSRPCHGPIKFYTEKSDWKDLVLFHEYFHAETGMGLGASHQTGWTALVAKLIEDQYQEKF